MGKTTLLANGKSLITVVFLLLCAFPAYCQLPAFTLIVSHTDQTCLGNGTMTFSVSGTAPGSSVLYSIYEFPNLTTPMAVQSASVLGSLSAGSYNVVATQSLGSQTNTQETDVTIENHIQQLQYNLQGVNAVCGPNGKIIVNVTSGIGVSYEIFAGPVIVPSQSSNVLEGLTAGIYQVRVFNNCGEGVVQTFELFESQAGISLGGQDPVPSDCGEAQVGVTISNAGTSVVAYPLTVVCVVQPPTGPPITYTQIINAPAPPATYTNYFEYIPTYEGQAYGYTVTITDNCGNIYTTGQGINNLQVDPTASPFNNACDSGGIFVQNVTALVMTEAPASYPPTLPLDLTSQINAVHTVTINSAPEGYYTFLATGLCGQIVELHVQIVPPTQSAPGANSAPDCDPTMGSLYLAGTLTNVVLTGAPSTYVGAVPQDLSFNIDPFTHAFTMNSLPVGNYVFHTTDNCGATFDVPVFVSSYQSAVTVDVIENCNSFNINLTHVSTGISPSFWLQKFDAISNSWEHPQSGADYIEGNPLSSSNAYMLNSSGTTYNLAFNGIFRILRTFPYYNNGSSIPLNCIAEVYNFEYRPGPQIIDVYSFACDNDLLDIIVNAIGEQPLIYRITTKNGAPFVIENGTSATFTGLEAATYNIQVQDPCGNILNRIFEIYTPASFEITASGLCDGQEGGLSVPDFPFLNYTWWKGNNSSNVIGNTASLAFTPFDPASDSGVYHVRIQNPDADSCIDLVLDYIVSPTGTIPQAGADVSVIYCDRPNIDLTTLLVAPFTAGGTWSVVSGNVAPQGNIWNASGLPAGTYQLQYNVTSLCGSDESLISIILQTDPGLPIASATGSVCFGGEISLNAIAPAGASVHWSGPNGFSSDENNPVIENASVSMSGTYTVTSSLGSCTSLPVAVPVTVLPPPTLDIEAVCNENRFMINAQPHENSFDAEAATYVWLSPNGTALQGNPVDITGAAPGMYSVAITTADGCSTSGQVLVARTLCTVPLGISPNGDGNNDNWNLEGLDIVKLEIFSRYGNIVYEANQYKDEWYGQDFKGRPLPDGTYYYYMKLTTGAEQTGWVYVITGY